MTTYTALTTLTDKQAANALGEALERLEPAPTGIGVFDVEDGTGTWEVGSYFTERPDQAGLALLATIHGARPFAVSKLDDRDWVAQVRRELTPVAAGRFVVFGGHDADMVPGNKVRLEIEAAMAFGTGHHATTQGCLRALDKIMRQGRIAASVADIGCGTGVLAMAAHKVWRTPTLAADIDPVAVATARANMRANGIGSAIPCLTAAGFRHSVIRGRAPFDLVFGNILAGPLKRMAPDMARMIAPGGIAILSGMLNPQARLVAATYAGHGFSRIDAQVIGEWTTLVLQRR